MPSIEFIEKKVAAGEKALRYGSQSAVRVRTSVKAALSLWSTMPLEVREANGALGERLVMVSAEIEKRIAEHKAKKQ